MNKFKKLLVIMLVLAVSLTVFAVVAFASGEEPLEKHQALLELIDYENKNEGDLAEANPAGAGHFEIAAAENGNKYIKHHVSAGTGNTSYAGIGYKSNKNYSISEYPYCTFDFDIAKIEGDYAGASFNPMYYANGPVYDDSGNLSETLSNVDAGSTSLALSSFQKYLPQEYNTWAHVTVIFKYHIQDDAEYIGGYVYVNGELVYQNATLHTLSTKYLASNYYFGTFRINNSGGTNTKNFTGYDNWQINYFNKAYTDEEVVKFLYHENYELPYGVTVAKIGHVPYDSIPKAIEAYKPGDVITLVSDIDNVISVEKPIVFDTNKYNEDGTPSGKFYSIPTTSTTLLSSLQDGILSFKQVQNASVEVYWDDCPGKALGKACTCPSEYLNENGEHRMYQFVPSAMLNSVPVYTGEIPTFPIVEGVSMQFVGWSYTQGGEAEEVKAISAEDLPNGYVALYPVYKTLQYSLEVISPSGQSTYYLEKEYDAAFSSAPANSTIKLHTNVLCDAQIELVEKNLTVDLNGFSLCRNKYTVTDYAATYDSSTGKYVKGAKIADPVTVSVSGTLFYSKAGNFTFTVTSSRPGAVLSSIVVSADRWICDGVPVNVDNVVSTSGGRLFNLDPSNATYNIVSEKGYIAIYAGCLFYGEHGRNDNTLSTNFDGTNIYIIGNHDEGGNAIRNGGNHYFKNCTIVGSGNNLHKNGNNNGDRNKDSNFFYENCDISNGTFYSAASTDTFTFTDCRLNVMFKGTFELCIGENTYSVNDPSAFATYIEDTSIEKRSVSEPCNKVTGVQINLDPVTLRPLATPSLNETSGTYSYYYFNPLHGPTNVIFKDLEGNVISEVVAVKNKVVSAPAIPLGDGWREVTNPIWRDAEGNISNLMLGDANEYVFTAELPAENEREYDSHLTAAKINMSYYSSFAYNIYVPKVDGIDVVSIGGAAPQATVLIKGDTYYIYTVYVNTLNAFDDCAVTVEYVIDGQSFASELTVSAYIYAMASVEDSDHTALDKEATGALVRYIEECYKFNVAGAALSDELQAKFDAFYAKYTPADYVTEYPQEEFHDVNESAIDGLIESMYFRVRGSSIDFAVSLTEEAMELNYKISFATSEYEVINEGKLFCTEGMPLYASLMSSSYTINVVDAEGNVVMRDLDKDGTAETAATTQYSMVTYISCMEADGYTVDIVKALYALGKATLAVRNNTIG